MLKSEMTPEVTNLHEDLHDLSLLLGLKAG